MSLAFLLLALASAGAASAPAQVAADRGGGRCVAGTPEPSMEPLRPMQVAICDYEPAEFHAGIDRLMATREGRIGIEEVERIFAMPPISTTLWDNPRSAEYRVLLVSAPGREPWSAVVYVTEGYGPDIESRPIRFRGSGRPVRIDPSERGDIRVALVLRSDVVLTPGQAFCLPVAELRDRALRGGWTIARSEPASAHAPLGWRNISLRRGGMNIITNESVGHSCVEILHLSQPGDPPIQPITPEEQAAIRRSNAK